MPGFPVATPERVLDPHLEPSSHPRPALAASKTPEPFRLRCLHRLSRSHSRRLSPGQELSQSLVLQLSRVRRPSAELGHPASVAPGPRAAPQPPSRAFALLRDSGLDLASFLEQSGLSPGHLPTVWHPRSQASLAELGAPPLVSCLSRA